MTDHSYRDSGDTRGIRRRCDDPTKWKLHQGVHWLRKTDKWDFYASFHLFRVEKVNKTRRCPVSETIPATTTWVPFIPCNIIAGKQEWILTNGFERRISGGGFWQTDDRGDTTLVLVISDISDAAIGEFRGTYNDDILMVKSGYRDKWWSATANLKWCCNLNFQGTLYSVKGEGGTLKQIF